MGLGLGNFLGFLRGLAEPDEFVCIFVLERLFLSGFGNPWVLDLNFAGMPSSM